MAHKDKKNYLINQLFVRQELDECLKLIEQVLEETEGICEYALYIKALIKRQKGQIQESLQLFQQATTINPHNIANVKQVGRSLFLLGKHKAALEVYDEAQKIGAPDWEIMHNKGLCYMYLKQYDAAVDCFRFALDIQPHDSTFMQLGKVYTLLEDHDAAITTYGDALNFSPENTEILTTLGCLYLRCARSDRALDCLTTSLKHDPKDARTILAAGSLMQDNADMDVALVKYRIAAVTTPNSPQLWNNIGMCFFGKQRYIAAIACLKKALYLGPFEWVVAYNLGLVHLHTEQAASAFHYLSSAINLKPDFAQSYLYLAVALTKLGDKDNASAAYQKAIQVAGHGAEPVFHLNYAIMLAKMRDYDTAAAHLQQYEELFDAQDLTVKMAEPEMMEQSALLRAELEAAQHRGQLQTSSSRRTQDEYEEEHQEHDEGDLKSQD